MNNQEKFDYWKDIAIYDLSTAEAMYTSKRYLYVSFMCQQAIEKLVKGIFVFHYYDEAPRTHNIWILLSQLMKDGKFGEDINVYLENNKVFFADLVYYYISERYPDYKANVASRMNKENALALLTLTKEVFECLMSPYK